jgi:PPOX class probable F420-dependent enzyme
MATIPASHADLLKEKKAFANLATLNADGSPQVTPVWVDFDGTHVLVNTAKGRVKTKNLEREPRVALAISEPENPYRYLGIQGRVTEITESGADAHIDKMAHKYMGKDYPFRQPGEVRVIVKIAPDKVHTNG